MKSNLRTTPVMDEIQKINFEGNIIPQSWYENIRFPKNEKFESEQLQKKQTTRKSKGRGNGTDFVAIVILADIVYWYRPKELQDGATGKTYGYARRFESNKLQRSYADLGDQFGISKEQARDACYRLRNAGLITIEIRHRIRTRGGLICNNVVYLEPVPARISEITYRKRLKKESGESETILEPNRRLGSKSKLGVFPKKPSSALEGSTNTEINSEINSEINYSSNSTFKASPAAKSAAGLLERFLRMEGAPVIKARQNVEASSPRKRLRKRFSEDGAPCGDSLRNQPALEETGAPTLAQKSPLVAVPPPTETPAAPTLQLGDATITFGHRTFEFETNSDFESARYMLELMVRLRKPAEYITNSPYAAKETGASWRRASKAT